MPENIPVTFNGDCSMIFDYLFDYLLTGDLDYKTICDNAGCDVNPNHWKKYYTCYGNFTHFINLYTGQVL